jgi:hypothetical protein
MAMGKQLWLLSRASEGVDEDIEQTALYALAAQLLAKTSVALSNTIVCRRNRTVIQSPLSLQRTIISSRRSKAI